MDNLISYARESKWAMNPNFKEALKEESEPRTQYGEGGLC